MWQKGIHLNSEASVPCTHVFEVSRIETVPNSKVTVTFRSCRNNSGLWEEFWTSFFNIDELCFALDRVDVNCRGQGCLFHHMLSLLDVIWHENH